MSESLMAELFRKQAAKMGYENSEAQEDVGYLTGFLNFDYLNGYINTQKVNGELQDYFTLGITDGSYVCFIGNAGTGKTTLVTQIAANIARQYKTTTIFEDNTEAGLTTARRRSLSLFSEQEYKERYIVRNSGITIENFYDRINEIYKLKIENREKFMYDTGKNDLYGNPIMKLEPTIYILDSIANIMPKDIDEADELAGKSAGAAAAQAMSRALKQILQKLKAANIILLATNHIKEDVQMTMFPKKAALPGLKQGERIPKGRDAVYLANNIIRLDHVEKLNEDKTYKLEGSVVEVSLVKSRTSGKKKGTRLVYDFSNGFDPWLSLLEYLRNNKLLYGSSTFMALDPDKKFVFTNSNFREKLQEEEFRNAFMRTVIADLKTIPNRPILAQNLHTDDLLTNPSLFSL